MPILAGATDPAQRANAENLAMVRSLADAKAHEAARDTIVRQLRKADPKRWTYTALAKAVGITVYRVTQILKG